MPELPLSAFDLSWSANRILICSGFYGPHSNAEHMGAMIEFKGVHAFAAFDGFSDTQLDYHKHHLPLRTPVPYGGCWPFVEVRESNWVKEIADEHAALGETHGFTHWAVLTYDQTLHVMAPSRPEPKFIGWIS